MDIVSWLIESKLARAIAGGVLLGVATVLWLAGWFWPWGWLVDGILLLLSIPGGRSGLLRLRPLAGGGHTTAHDDQRHCRTTAENMLNLVVRARVLEGARAHEQDAAPDAGVTTGSG